MAKIKNGSSLAWITEITKTYIKLHRDIKKATYAVYCYY